MNNNHTYDGYGYARRSRFVPVVKAGTSTDDTDDVPTWSVVVTVGDPQTNYRTLIRMKSQVRATPAETSNDADEPAAPPNAAIGDEAERRELLAEIRRRTVQLEARYFEDYNRPLDAKSKAAYETFMRHGQKATLPLLGAEADGALIATWVSGAECLSLRFAERFRLDYAVTFVDGNEVKRDWGKSTLAEIFTECPQLKRLVSL